MEALWRVWCGASKILTFRVMNVCTWNRWIVALDVNVFPLVRWVGHMHWRRQAKWVRQLLFVPLLLQLCLPVRPVPQPMNAIKSPNTPNHIGLIFQTPSSLFPFSFLSAALWSVWRLCVKYDYSLSVLLYSNGPKHNWLINWLYWLYWLHNAMKERYLIAF